MLQIGIAFEFMLFSPLKKNQEEENPVKLINHPRCFQMIPFCTGTSKQSHCGVGGYHSFFTPLLEEQVWLSREGLRGRAPANGEAHISSEGSCVCATVFSWPN